MAITAQNNDELELKLNDFHRCTWHECWQHALQVAIQHMFCSVVAWILILSFLCVIFFLSDSCAREAGIDSPATGEEVIRNALDCIAVFLAASADWSMAMGHIAKASNTRPAGTMYDMPCIQTSGRFRYLCMKFMRTICFETAIDRLCT